MRSGLARALVVVVALMALVAPLQGGASTTSALYHRQYAYNDPKFFRPQDIMSFYVGSHHDRVEWHAAAVDRNRSISWKVENNYDEHIITCTLAAGAVDKPTCSGHYHRPAKLTITFRPPPGQGGTVISIWGDPNPQ